MKVTFGKCAMKLGREQRQRVEPLTSGQAARVQELVRGTLPKLNTNRVVRHMVRDGGLFGGLFERQVNDAAAALGVNLSTLNTDQKRLLVQMATQVLTDTQRRRMLADAA